MDCIHVTNHSTMYCALIALGFLCKTVH